MEKYKHNFSQGTLSSFLSFLGGRNLIYCTMWVIKPKYSFVPKKSCISFFIWLLFWMLKTCFLPFSNFGCWKANFSTGLEVDYETPIILEQIELQAKLLYYFLGSNKSNINQTLDPWDCPGPLPAYLYQWRTHSGQIQSTMFVVTFFLSCVSFFLFFFLGG